MRTCCKHRGSHCYHEKWRLPVTRTSIPDIGEDLCNIMKQISYRSVVSYLPDTNGMDIQVFDQDSLSDQYYLDTSHCVTKSKRFNNHCLYDTFTEYCTLSGMDVKRKLITELKEHEDWYIIASAACLGMRSVKYEEWFKKLQKARTWPNELALYALCIIFHRNACMFNNGRIWTTLEVTPSMSIGTIQEMCETSLVYLGNNIYGILCHRPFTLECPIPFDLDDIQRVRPLTYDNNFQKMYFKMHLNSEYEILVTEEEITSPEDVKPIIVSPPVAPSIFDASYDLATTEIKKEPEDLPAKGLTSRSIGELIIMLPDFIARSIKQEILDTAATAMVISAKHSPSCKLNGFVDTHEGISGLQIKDVCSLVLADQSVCPERVPIEPVSSSLTTLPSTGSTIHTVDLSTIMQPPTPQQAAAAMPTTATISSLHVVTLDKVITNTPLPTVTVCTATTSEQINLSSNIHTLLPVQATTQNHKLTPLPMVTDCPAVQVTCHQNTPSSSHIPLPVVSLAANVFPLPLPMAMTSTATLNNIVSTPSHTLKWSRVQNKLVEVDPNTLPTTMIAETSTDNSSIIQKPITDSGKHSTSSKK